MMIFLSILCFILFLLLCFCATVATSAFVYFGVYDKNGKILNENDLENIMYNARTVMDKKKKYKKQCSHPKMGGSKIHERTYY